MSSQKNPNLKHNSALYEQRLLWNVPSKLFVLACAFVLIVFFSAGWFAAIIIFLITIPPLVIIHKHDDKALPILFDKLFRPDFYSAGGTDEKMMKLLRQRKGEFQILNLNEITEQNANRLNSN